MKEKESLYSMVRLFNHAFGVCPSKDLYFPAFSTFYLYTTRCISKYPLSKKLITDSTFQIIKTFIIHGTKFIVLNKKTHSREPLGLP
ncbi:MAG: hypothetical protein A2845_02455 [Candidatus Lloydbacteria bacterium RIFCSPHIGHO2_01_FULL_49_22]|uniref:Uncharacterized protein n=1 Tax=Candidatus Lloydbacteria bacterium RIFCSPHIGHO2_01_FULL_49_22 TaxID=1798658 RepID=A0A1G2CV74_9BACT|nr:MAG: hypothetical protein A2845_02455 [Candidatus Lloydbacteria bacterium RIFCSPHIGHO2_01_FULL_49_22]OGZ10309.1 MAG: hypothetical protein A3C14_02155 [Candidatus Lloydbacteria bacterium RIFCSPHIGHO2_02_FULL_50_18]